jgi:predicted NBD/HSP70 family sugar kinase
MKRAPTGARPSLLRQLNERQVLAAVQAHGALSRAEITRLTGISGPTVTRAVGALLDANLLEEGDFRQAALGRPGKSLRLAVTSVCVLGAVVGAERCEVVASGLDGQLHDRQTAAFATPADYDDLINEFARNLEAVAESLDTEVLGLGVCVPGLLQGAEKRTLLSPNLHQTDGRQIGKDLQDRLGIDTIIVQETDALCLAEKMFGAARDVDDFAMLDIETGLGMGVVHRGQLLEGHSGLAGELGHITVQLEGRKCGCGNRGCLETVATDASLVHALSAKLGRKLTIDDIVHGVQTGTIAIGPEFENLVQYLAVAVAAVINIFNPKRLFLHGRFFDAGPQLFPRLLELTRQRSLAPSFADCEIIRARGNKRLAAIAAVLHRITTGWDGSGSLG